MAGAKTGINVRDCDEAFHHESRTDQKDGGKRDFRHDEQVAESPGWRGRAPATRVAERRVHIRARRLQGRGDTEKNRGPDRDRGGERRTARLR